MQNPEDTSPQAPSPKGQAFTVKPDVQARADERKARAAQTLRENLMRRKQQGRARRAGAADETNGLPAAKLDESQD
ncbi:hypothetical protein IFT84_03280 [Rhizobium sp. CFBP 8762]|uniref:hypothetical protein n=1 Tax=Rhizobium sp. CFBP 8762 TaxID=2775279 RepID=UPI00177B3F94|nr:hypothetical protein [Rhizobium sp. CFBP 8762]MBD8553538.1 hypothetical protein [Rhizobium sp. CFBP 8762]